MARKYIAVRLADWPEQILAALCRQPWVILGTEAICVSNAQGSLSNIGKFVNREPLRDAPVHTVEISYYPTTDQYRAEVSQVGVASVQKLEALIASGIQTLKTSDVFVYRAEPQ